MLSWFNKKSFSFISDPGDTVLRKSIQNSANDFTLVGDDVFYPSQLLEDLRNDGIDTSNLQAIHDSSRFVSTFYTRIWWYYFEFSFSGGPKLDFNLKLKSGIQRSFYKSARKWGDYPLDEISSSGKILVPYAFGPNMDQYKARIRIWVAFQKLNIQF